MMKKTIFLAIILVVCNSMMAAPVDSLTAKMVGENFLKEKNKLKQHVHSNILTLEFKGARKSYKNKELFFIYNIREIEGFVLVSADDRAFPVLGYSFENSYDITDQNKPEAFKEWLESTGDQLQFIFESGLKSGNEIKAAWEYYGNNQFKSTKDLKDAGPLLTTKWNQGTYYNSLCPEGTGGQNGHMWVGCVAVAMGQVMKYWNYPDYGSGEHSYTCSPYGIQSANFAQTHYNWSAMPNSLSAENLPVATILYHCGVSVNMHYAPGGSGAYMSSAANALKKYFDYSFKTRILYRSSYSPAVWDSLMRDQIDKGQPVAYAGGSHAFNIDGYQGTDYFHVNWGWGGSYNGYFYFSALNPGSSNFTSGQHAIVDIRPNYFDNSTETLLYNEFSGTITDNGGKYNNYLNQSDSRILISPPGVSNIKLFFNEFNTVENQDSLYIYDGENGNSPLLAAVSGNTGPFEIMGASGKIFLHFRSNAYTTQKGYEINYISAFDDTGITGLLYPTGKTCGKLNDSIVVIVKNFGINTKTNIPVTVKINTPRGAESYQKTIPGPLKTFDSDTVFIHSVNTTDPGNYYFTSYTRTTGDVLINTNDTVKQTVNIKEIRNLPYFENVDSLDPQRNDWVDLNYKTWISMEKDRSNSFFRAYVGGGESGGGTVGEGRSEQFFIYDRKIGPITKNANLYFDYRITTGYQTPVPVELNSNEEIRVIISTSCGHGFDTIYSIGVANHFTDSNFRKVLVPLGNYQGQNVIIGFTTQWDSVFAYIDYDNILLVDSLKLDTEVKQKPGTKTLVIFPSPSRDDIHILNSGIFSKEIELFVFDLSGKIVLNEKRKNAGELLKIDIKDLVPGVYFLKIQSGAEVYKGKFVKE
jgi:hypothetical protein